MLVGQGAGTCENKGRRGTGGWEPRRIRAGGGQGVGAWENKGRKREEAERDARSHARAGGRRRMKDVKIFYDFLVCF